MLIHQASWISLRQAASTAVPVFRRKFSFRKALRSASLEVTCDGVYEAVLNSLLTAGINFSTTTGAVLGAIGVALATVLIYCNGNNPSLEQY